MDQDKKWVRGRQEESGVGIEELILKQDSDAQDISIFVSVCVLCGRKGRGASSHPS